METEGLKVQFRPMWETELERARGRGAAAPRLRSPELDRWDPRRRPRRGILVTERSRRAHWTTSSEHSTESTEVKDEE